MVNLMDQPDCAVKCPDIWLNVISECIWEVFCIYELLDCTKQVPPPSAVLWVLFFLSPPYKVAGHGTSQLLYLPELILGNWSLDAHISHVLKWLITFSTLQWCIHGMYSRDTKVWTFPFWSFLELMREVKYPCRQDSDWDKSPSYSQPWK